MKGRGIRVGGWLRRLAHPRAWPVRWRLAAVSSGLTLIILVLFGGAIGKIATQRIRDDFNNEVRSAVQILASEMRIEYPLFGEPKLQRSPQLDSFVLPDDASARVFDVNGKLRGQSTNAAALGPPKPGISDYGDVRVATERIINDAGRKVETIEADLTAPADLRSVEDILQTNARISLLVNNAGVGATAPLLASDVDKMEDMIRLNVTALTRLTYAVVPGFVARGTGTIINISSVVAIAPERLNGVYGATKAFVLALTHSLVHELADKGVRVQAVLPGATATEFWDIAGKPVHQLPAEIVMSADDLVDAALAGLDLGETVTLPSLPNLAEWDRYEAARHAMSSKVSSAIAAPRYNLRQHGRLSA